MKEIWETKNNNTDNKTNNISILVGFWPNGNRKILKTIIFRHASVLSQQDKKWKNEVGLSFLGNIFSCVILPKRFDTFGLVVYHN